jgi:hypothetical protein
VLVGDSIDIVGGVKGPVGIGNDVAEFATSAVDAVEMSSARMIIRDNAVFFIQEQRTSG